jgi:hypothetical protein
LLLKGVAQEGKIMVEIICTRGDPSEAKENNKITRTFQFRLGLIEYVPDG